MLYFYTHIHLDYAPYCPKKISYAKKKKEQESSTEKKLEQNQQSLYPIDGRTKGPLKTTQIIQFSIVSPAPKSKSGIGPNHSLFFMGGKQKETLIIRLLPFSYRSHLLQPTKHKETNNPSCFHSF